MCNGKHVGAILYVFKICVESISPRTLVDKCLKHSYPVMNLCFALQQHLAKRSIQVSGICSVPVLVHNRIQGVCTRSLL